ncbi:MAG: hypothetical protein ACE5I3_11530 [Phycisphaerae bacterium]
MRIVLKIFVGLIVLVAALFMALLIHLRIGPTGPVPKVDPIVTLNQQHANLAENGAPLYLAAHELYVPAPDEDWLRGDVDWSTEADAITTWLEQNAACIEQTRAAGEIPECWFELSRDADGWVDLPYVSEVKTLMRFWHLRGVLAAERHDLPTLEDTLRTRDNISCHLLQQPFIIPHLIGIVGKVYVQDFVLKPFTWTELSDEGRAAYFERIKYVFEPPPTAVAAIQTERDEMCWNPWYRGDEPALFMPLHRFAGELDRYLTPQLKLAAQRPERQLDPENPLRKELHQLHSWTPSLSNPVRSELVGRIPAFSRALEIRARLVATQRGNQTVAEIFKYRHEHGRLPESLDVLQGEHIIDPYTAKPFLYRVTDEGFTLYSAGIDRDDDGGVHHLRWGRQRGEEGKERPPPDGDYVFWPLPE